MDQRLFCRLGAVVLVSTITFVAVIPTIVIAITRIVRFAGRPSGLGFWLFTVTLAFLWVIALGLLVVGLWLVVCRFRFLPGFIAVITRLLIPVICVVILVVAAVVLAVVFLVALVLVVASRVFLAACVPLGSCRLLRGIVTVVVIGST